MVLRLATSAVVLCLVAFVNANVEPSHLRLGHPHTRTLFQSRIEHRILSGSTAPEIAREQQEAAEEVTQENHEVAIFESKGMSAPQADAKAEADEERTVEEKDVQEEKGEKHELEAKGMPPPQAEAKAKEDTKEKIEVEAREEETHEEVSLEAKGMPANQAEAKAVDDEKHKVQKEESQVEKEEEIETATAEHPPHKIEEKQCGVGHGGCSGNTFCSFDLANTGRCLECSQFQACLEVKTAKGQIACKGKCAAIAKQIPASIGSKGLQRCGVGEPPCRDARAFCNFAHDTTGQCQVRASS